MDALVDCIVLGLATWQAVEIYQHGALFDRPRDWALRWKDSDVWWRMLPHLFACPFCLAPWTAASLWWQSSGHPTQSWMTMVLAAVRLAQLGNDLCHDITRSPASTVAVAEEFEDVDDSVVANTNPEEPDA